MTDIVIRLLGLFIWSIDLDTLDHAALNAVLYPTGLGKFSQQNGIGVLGFGNYTGAIGDSCMFGGKFSHRKIKCC
jgi:hypothetical protein